MDERERLITVPALLFLIPQLGSILETGWFIDQEQSMGEQAQRMGSRQKAVLQMSAMALVHQVRKRELSFHPGIQSSSPLLRE